jgi:hypothetical protein
MWMPDLDGFTNLGDALRERLGMNQGASLFLGAHTHRGENQVGLLSVVPAATEHHP